MKTYTTRSRRWLFAAVAATALAAWLPAFAHEAKCPVCKLDVPQDTEQQDNEVALRSGRKRIEYRCLYCAVTDAKTYAGDISILAPSDVKGKPVLLSRKEGKWSVQPEGAVFVAGKLDHKQCPVLYRAFTSKPALEAWSKKNQAALGASKPLSLPQFLELAK